MAVQTEQEGQVNKFLALLEEHGGLGDWGRKEGQVRLNWTKYILLMWDRYVDIHKGV